MALAHRNWKLDSVFCIKMNTKSAFDAFIASPETGQTLTLEVPKDVTALRGQSLPIGIVSYTVGDTEYCLATTLLESDSYPVPALSDLYHGRWGIEELFWLIDRKPATSQSAFRRIIS